VISVLVVTQLGACASTLRNVAGPMSAQDAQAYAHLPPQGFVRRRFYDEEINGVQDGVDSFLDKMMAFQRSMGTPNPHENKPRNYRPAYLEKESVVIWPAYFTDTNYRQLLRPRGDLQSYCESISRGRWVLTQPYNQDPIAESMTDPLAAYVGAERETFGPMGQDRPSTLIRVALRTYGEQPSTPNLSPSATAIH
jgi:hypothetical protein